MASEKITAIIDEIKGLSILELKELIDTYCEEFGVSAVAAAPAAAAAAASKPFAAVTPPLISVIFIMPSSSLFVKRFDIFFI